MLWCFEEVWKSLREDPFSFSPPLEWQDPSEQDQMQLSGEPGVTRGSFQLT